MIDVCIGLYSMIIYIHIHIFQSLDAEILSFHVYGIKKNTLSVQAFFELQKQKDAKKRHQKPNGFWCLKSP